MTKLENIITYTSLSLASNENKILFERHIDTLEAIIKNKRGCIKCQWFEDPKDVSKYFMYIEFDNEQNFTAYREAEDVLETIHTKTAPLLSGPPKFKYFIGRVLKENL